MTTAPAGARRHLVDSPFNNRPVPVIEVFAVDDRVTHDRFGLGRVVSKTGDRSVIVDFGKERVQVKTPFTRLFKL